MVIASLQEDFAELDYPVAFRSVETPDRGRQISSKEKQNTQSRFRRGGQNRARLLNGSHRRRNKRNYL